MSAGVYSHLCYRTKADIWFYLPATKCDYVGVGPPCLGTAWCECREQGEREAYPYFCTLPHYFDACLLALASRSDAVHVRCLDTGCCWQVIRSVGRCLCVGWGSDVSDFCCNVDSNLLLVFLILLGDIAMYS